MQNVYVKDCKHGKGVFAARDFRERESILIFKGSVISFEETKQGAHGHCALQIGGNKYISMNAERNFHFVDHSCDPNAGLVSSIKLIAIREIKKDEEITFDYSTSMGEDYWTMKCECGDPNCRGVIKDFKYLPKELQEKYIKLGIVPNWLLESLRINISPILVKK